jgi:5'-nucleotidase
MRILLTNDDGVHAPGLAVLAEIARALSDDVWIVAPAEEQSGAGHSLTITRPLRVHQHGEKHYSVTGTPTDAVMMAVARLMNDTPPDLILSGINRGANLGEDVTYSGTVSAAMEGALAGIPSIALSQVYAREGAGLDVSFAASAAWGEQVVRKVISQPMPPRTLVNINFPALPADQVRGVKVVNQGFRDYGRLKIVTNTDPRGFEYHWFGLGAAESSPAHSTDLEAVADGFIAVTPLHLDLTHHQSIAALTATFAAD